MVPTLAANDLNILHLWMAAVAGMDDLVIMDYMVLLACKIILINKPATEDKLMLV